MIILLMIVAILGAGAGQSNNPSVGSAAGQQKVASHC